MRRRGPRLKAPPGVHPDELRRVIAEAWNEVGKYASTDDVEDYLREVHREVFQPLAVVRSPAARAQLYRRLRPGRVPPEPVLFRLFTPNAGPLKVRSIDEIQPDGSHRRLSREEARELPRRPFANPSDSASAGSIPIPPAVEQLFVRLSGRTRPIEGWSSLVPALKELTRMPRIRDLDLWELTALMDGLAIRERMMCEGHEQTTGQLLTIKRRLRLHQVRSFYRLLRTARAKYPEPSSTPSPTTPNRSTLLLRFSR